MLPFPSACLLCLLCHHPQGEEYAVQKVLSHYQSDLRAVFLYYAQLDASFAEHWPPSLTFSTFMLYCKDSQTSGVCARLSLTHHG